MSAEAETVAQTHPFQAEVAELLRLMVHSVYSEADIFLRELISNASDACDKLRYEAIAKPELLADGRALAIRIKPDAAAGTLTVEDTGIGMDRQELIDNLGTVARSGTRAFIERLTEAKDGAGLIGQFGVGFYSAFMVADRIEVTSRRAGAAEAWLWTSSGGAGFEIAPASEAQAARVPRGTEIVLHLKADAKRYLEPYEVERVVHTYSDHMLFAPSTPPFDLFDRGRKGHVKLYVRRVFITDDAELLPTYLRFMRGVVDSEDLPLNISREMLQNNPQVAQMRKALTGRVIAELESLAAKESSDGDEAKAYTKIWEAFGPVLKEGIYDDFERRTQLLGLARFTTTTGTGRSLKQYLAGLKTNQTEIYYLVGDSIERLKSNPKLEAARARGIEVLLLTDPVDAFWLATPLDFEGK